MGEGLFYHVRDRLETTMNEPEQPLPALAEITPATTDLQPPPPTPPSPLIHTAFIGPDGLRAGWRFAIYVACVFAILYGLAWATRPLIPHRPHEAPPVWVFLFGELESLVAANIDIVAAAVARDITLFEQQGCLSPHHVIVEDADGYASHWFAERLAIALNRALSFKDTVAVGRLLS